MSHRITALLRNRTRIAVLAAVAVVAACLVPLVWGGFGFGAAGGTDQSAGPAGTTPQADFDGDGTADLVAAAPMGKVHGKKIGYVTVTYGSNDGPGAGRRQLLTQEDGDIPGKPEKNPLGDYWESKKPGDDAVARDFDGDGYTDLALNVDYGADYYDSGGDVAILWGSDNGLSDSTRLPDVSDGRKLTQDFASEDATEASLTGGDFDGDGNADLVLGLGSKKGLLKGPFDRNGKPDGVGGVPEPDLSDSKGPEPPETTETVAGDMNGDGTDDLLSLHDGQDDSLANFYAGGRDGFHRPDKSRMPGGSTATVGDVDNDGYGDVVRSGSGRGDGSITVFPGSENGPDSSRRKVIDQDTPGVPGKKGKNSAFGRSLDAGDVDGDGYADIAVGNSDAKAGGRDRAGTVTLLKGGKHGLTGHGSQTLDKARGLPPKTRIDGGFGSDVRLLDRTGDGNADLAAGASTENGFDGAVWLLRTDGGKVTGKDSAVSQPTDFGAQRSADNVLGGDFAR